MSTTVRFIEPSAHLFNEASELRYRALYADLGLAERPDFDDRSPEANHLVAISGGRVVGYLRMNVRPTTAQLRHLCVAEPKRGSGVGRMLVSAAIAHARTVGLSTVWVNARFTAIGFWRQMGFGVMPEALAQAEQTRIPHKRMQLQVRS
jgi:N-acetylglutamate synthase-like GNAT family acetyltransferase